MSDRAGTIAHAAPTERAALLGRMSPFERAAGRYLRGPDGDEASGHAPAGDGEAGAGQGSPEGAQSGAPAQGAEGQSPAPAAAATPSRPEGIPDEFWDDKSGLKIGDIASALRDFQSSRADVPATADAYELKLSDAVKVPAGFEVTISKDDPLFQRAAAVLHKAGFGQAAMQELVDAFGQVQIDRQQGWVDNWTNELASLGSNAKERWAAVQTWAKANLPADQADELLLSVDSANGVKALEAIIKLRSPVPGPGGKATGAAELEGLSPGDRLTRIREQQHAARTSHRAA